MSILKSVISILLILPLINADYNAKRDALIDKEYSMSIAGDVELNDAEKKANDVLLVYVDAEFNSGIMRPQFYPALQEPQKLKQLVENSTVFKIIKAMPKGALLHVHCLGMSSSDYVFSLTHKDDLWVCDTTDKPFQIKFAHGGDDTCPWQLVKDIRAKDPFFDIYLQNQLSLVKSYAHTLTNQDYYEVIRNVGSLVGFKDNFGDHVYNALSEAYEDGIRHMEIRCALFGVYDLDGNVYDHNNIAKIIKTAAAKFQRRHPDFVSLKLIFSIPRSTIPDQLDHYFEIFKNLKKIYGDFLIGFDFDGDEDLSAPLKEIQPALAKLREEIQADLYIHAGNTGFYGIWSDENLVDALLLDAKRISHGWALAKHPLIMRGVKAKDICVEVSPLSDYYDYDFYTDIRNHPAAQFGMYNVPYVLSNGNPALYRSKGVNYDWYLAYMGYTHGRDDLRFLKKIALNSIKYSTVTDQERSRLQAVFDREWEEFIRKLGNNEIV